MSYYTCEGVQAGRVFKMRVNAVSHKQAAWLARGKMGESGYLLSTERKGEARVMDKVQE